MPGLEADGEAGLRILTLGAANADSIRSLMRALADDGSCIGILAQGEIQR